MVTGREHHTAASGAQVPTLVGTAARRRRALAHLSPIFDLHLNRARNPSAVVWDAYDFIALIQLTVDTIALSSGLDGNLGAPRDSVLDAMTRTAAAMAPHRPTDEHAHVAAHVLDHLLRHDETSPYFTVDYADPDTGWQVVKHPVRVLYETIAGDGATLDVNVDNAVVSLMLIATNRSVEDEHEAVIAVMQAQAESGRLDAAIESAEDAVTLSRTYAANLRRMINEAERDVARVDYLNALRPELAVASKHLERRITVDGTFLRHLENLRTDTSSDQDPRTFDQLAQAATSLSSAVETLAELHTEVIGATPRWRDAQAAQAFSAVPISDVDPTADVLAALLCGRSLPTGAALTPAAPALILDLTGLANRLVAPRRKRSEFEGHPDLRDLLEDSDGIHEQFPSQFHNTAHALRVRRIAPGMKARLSDLLNDADALFGHLDVAVTADLASLAGSPMTARARLRLLLALDALMLWRPDGSRSEHDDWWAVDDGTRAALPDLDIPDLILHRKDTDDEST